MERHLCASNCTIVSCAYNLHNMCIDSICVQSYGATHQAFEGYGPSVCDNIPSFERICELYREPTNNLPSA